MSAKISQKIELVANIAIVIVAVLLGYFLVQKLLFPPPNPQPTKEITKGAKINLNGVDWEAHQKTLLLVLQKGCKYCNESMPFYKTLIPRASEKGVRVIAVLPGPLEESSQYLNENGVQIQEIRQASLNTVNVHGTPTLILLNNRGEVSKSWVGKLFAEKEQEVIDQLQ